ncbi:MAG: DNA gyrase subunit A [Ruminococcaceae bacterium]|nr:DNA gyrase subunit A [Oscillospiraceae bacterium]
MEKNHELDYSNQKILPIGMESEVKKSFIDYSMSVITSRALPDVRDGMKPGQRRILYAMYEDHLTADKPFRKSATTVGNVLGRYHPHGDSAVYEAMVRMAQTFSLRYPLVEGHGNFGNVDGDGAAAYRYTEARLAKIADYMMLDIDKDVVDFVPNFDNKLKEPTVLPSRFPNLLVNGSVGIAVGMATNIPPHNLSEVIDGVICLIDNPAAELPEIMQYIKGPDFPTKATIYGTAGIYQAYLTGKGHVNVRAKATLEEDKHRIIFTEIPYQVNKSQLVKSIADLHKEKRIEGLTDLRDESGRAGMRIVVEYKRDANGQVILNQLYKFTQLQSTCAVNMLAIVNGEPKVLCLKDVLNHYISFQKDIIVRRTRYELNRALHEMHILEGYVIATDNIDRVIEIIKKSESIPAAREALMAEFSLSEPQAQAIVDMTLGRLSGLERQKIADRLDKLRNLVAELEGILADESKVASILKDELLAIKAKYGDDRLTEIIESEEEIVLEDLIPKHRCVVTMTHAGYIKRQPADTYSAQRRGGKGIIGMNTKDDDFIVDVVTAHSHALMMFFTNTGRVYSKKVYCLPEASRTARGSNIKNVLEMQDGERLAGVITVDGFEEGYLLTVTKRGIVKRTAISEFEKLRRTGKRALSLDEGDELIFAGIMNDEDEIVIATKSGRAVRFAGENIRPMGTGARGVIGIRVDEEDEVCGAAFVDPERKLLIITEQGCGKRTPFDDFRLMKHRGGSGVTCQNITEKTGRIASVASVGENDDIMMITDTGTVVRVHANEIPSYSRTATGVIVMRTAENATIVNFAVVPDGNKPEDEAEEIADGEFVEAKVVSEEEFIAEQAEKETVKAEIAEAFKNSEDNE